MIFNISVPKMSINTKGTVYINHTFHLIKLHSNLISDYYIISPRDIKAKAFIPSVNFSNEPKKST